MFTGVMLLLCIGASVGNDPSRGDDKRCGPYKYYDEQRLVCLDLCGRNNETRCKIERFCSTTVSWGYRVNTPICLPYCIHRCDSPQYCDHGERDCRPCDSLCSRPDLTQCRKYCYDVYVLLMTSPSDTTTSQDITTSQATTAGRDRATLVAPYEVVWSQNCSWKTIAAVLSCVTVTLLLGCVGTIICYCKMSASTTDFIQPLMASLATGGEAGYVSIPKEKQGESDTSTMDKSVIDHGGI